VATVTDLSDNALAELEAAVAAEKQARKERVEYVTVPDRPLYRWSEQRGLEYNCPFHGWRESEIAARFQTLRAGLRTQLRSCQDRAVALEFLSRLNDTGNL
jgi:hypothetical protein